MIDSFRPLLDRAAFGQMDLPQAVNTKAELITYLLRKDPRPIRMEVWLDEAESEQAEAPDNQKEERKLERQLIALLQQKWVQRMVESRYPLQEKMTLFWHNHFATSFVKVKRARLMARQNDLFYKYALGKFGDLLHAITTDAAMLIWLDGDDNTVKAPNENFSREVMELFTLGVGNYSEQDVREAARAFTGWKVTKEGAVQFRPKLHDTGKKSYLGKTGNFSGEDIVELILDQPQTARFLTEKLMRAFVTPKPRTADVEAFAKKYRDSDYDTGKLLFELFASGLFEREGKKRSLVRPPVDWLVSVLQATKADLKHKQIDDFMKQSGQILFHPPSVAGWEGGDSWLSTSSLLARFRLAQQIAGQSWSNTEKRHKTGESYLSEWQERLGMTLGTTSSKALKPIAEDKLTAKNGQHLLTLLLVSPEYQNM
ncbi:MAG: DUF1800 domain-containing protein [Clostridia bacterium]